MKLIYEVDSKLEYQSMAKQCIIPQPKIITVRNFDEDAYERFLREFSDAHNSGQNIIPVVINSYGGQVYSLMGMIDVVKNSKVPVATILQTKAMSCGIALFTSGTEGYRFISPYATLMMHEVSGGAMDKIMEMEVSVKEARRLNDNIYEEMAKNTGHKKDFFKKIAHDRGHTDWFITPKEAKKLNIANHIGIPDFKIKVSMEYELDFKS